MEMAGVSLTLMLLDDDRKKYLGMNLITWTE